MKNGWQMINSRHAIDEVFYAELSKIKNSKENLANNESSEEKSISRNKSKNKSKSIRDQHEFCHDISKNKSTLGTILCSKHIPTIDNYEKECQ